MDAVAHLVPYPVDARITETATLLVATINFRKRLGHPKDALAILATLLPRETIPDFDWATAGVEDGGPGKKQTWVYYLRVRKHSVAAASPSAVDGGAGPGLHSGTGAHLAEA